MWLTSDIFNRKPKKKPVNFTDVIPTQFELALVTVFEFIYNKSSCFPGCEVKIFKFLMCYICQLLASPASAL